MRMRLFLFILICLATVRILQSCRSSDKLMDISQYPGNSLIKWNNELTRIIIADVFSPPVCSRIYAYSNLAAYEALIPSDSTYSSFAKRLNGLKPLPIPDQAGINFDIASIIAFTTVSGKLVYNSEAVQELESRYMRELNRVGVPEKTIELSAKYGKIVGKHILEWSAEDGYLQRNSFPAYLVKKDVARWKPTPPDYMDAVEPSWGRLRPFVMDSSSQFRPPEPLQFDTSADSQMYKEAMLVYDAVSNPEAGYTDIAKYWDCNPNVSVSSGHVTYFQQQISPGGHWMFIAGSAADRENYSNVQTATVLTKVAISIADAFISCWEAKFMYTSIRPETYINAYIDKDWHPLIQTPPFPEYPSAHSAISSSAAAMLTHIFGNGYAFTDSAEVEFGRPFRKFKSFTEAAHEASISRLYGGIHFIHALNKGQEEGRNVAQFIINKFDGD